MMQEPWFLPKFYMTIHCSNLRLILDPQLSTIHTNCRVQALADPVSRQDAQAVCLHVSGTLPSGNTVSREDPQAVDSPDDGALASADPVSRQKPETVL